MWRAARLMLHYNVMCLRVCAACTAMLLSTVLNRGPGCGHCPSLASKLLLSAERAPQESLGPFWKSPYLDAACLDQHQNGALGSPRCLRRRHPAY